MAIKPYTYILRGFRCQNERYWYETFSIDFMNILGTKKKHVVNPEHITDPKSIYGTIEIKLKKIKYDTAYW